MGIKQVIVVRRDLNMRKGKMCAQAAHASMGFLLGELEKTPINDWNRSVYVAPFVQKWIEEGHRKIVVGVDSLDELMAVRNHAIREQICYYHVVVDQGLTEFKEPTVTCLALGPAADFALDPITGHLKLL